MKDTGLNRLRTICAALILGLAFAAFGGGLEPESGKAVWDGISWNVQYGPWGNGCVLNGTAGGQLSGDVTLPSELPCPFSDAIDSFMRVGRLGDNAFHNSAGLTSVTIPETVETIGGGAFAECTSLERVVLPEGLREIGGFSKCTALERIVLPEGLREIGEGAFKDCTSLEEIVIPDSVVHIAPQAFKGCTSLTRVDLGAGKLEIDDEAFAECSSLETVTGGTNVTRVLRSAFDKTPFLGSSSDEEFSYVIVGSILIGCRGRPPCTESTVDILTTRYDYHPIVIPEGVTEIAAGALAYSMSFATRDSRYDVVYPKLLKLPSTLRKIGAFAFCSVGFDSITTVEGGDNVTSVGTHVFSYSSVFLGCDWDGRLSASGLARIGKVLLGVRGEPPRDLVIPEGIESVAPDAFRYDSPADRDVLKGNLRRVGVGYEEGSIFDDYIGCDQMARYTNGFAKGWLSSVRFAGTCKAIGVRAFSRCPYLQSVDLAGVEEIGEKAFEDAVELRSVSHADGIVSVGKSAFSGCPLADWGLDGEGALRSIGDYAFQCCALTAPVMLTEGVTNVGQGAFDACHSMCGSVRLPSTLTEVPGLFNSTPISALVFPEGCKSVGGISNMDIEELVLPPGVETLGWVMFCPKLKRVVLSESLLEIGGAFWSCPSIEHFEMYGRPRVYDASGCPISESTECTNLTKVVLHPNPDESMCYDPERFKPFLCEGGEVVVTPSWSITHDSGSDYARVDGTPDAVGALKIPGWTWDRNEAVEVGELAPGLFKNQTELTEVTFPSGLWNIPDDAFEGCTGLTCVHVPAGIEWTVYFALENAGLDVDAITFDVILPDFEYVPADDRQSVEIRAIKGVYEDGLAVPEELDGLPVRTISYTRGYISHSDFSCKGTLTLPDSLQVLESGALCSMQDTPCLKIGAGLCRIVRGALSNNMSLESFDVSPDNAYFKSVEGCLLSKDGGTFYRCPGARSGTFVVPNGVRHIAADAFNGCLDVTRIVLPPSLVSVDAWAFDGCSSLAAFEMSAEGDACMVADDCLYTTDGKLLSVPCAKTGRLVVREGTVELGARAIAYTDVSEVVIPEGVTTIGDSCFQSFSLLALTLPSTVETLGRSALSCSSLEVVWVPASKLSLVQSALTSCRVDCDKIVFLEPGEPVVRQWLTEDDGNGGLVIKGVRPKSFGGTDLVVPAQIDGSNVTAIAEDAFERASKITSITLPDTVTSIGSWCFYACSSMTNFVFGDGIETIGGYAFYLCSSLTSVYAPPAKLDMVKDILSASYLDVSKIKFNGENPIPGADELVEYVDASGVIQMTNAVGVASSGSRVRWESGWYVVTNMVTLAEGVACEGEVNLILADGGDLTAKGLEGHAAVSVTGSLAIYGQKAGRGGLDADGRNEGGAGIGGDFGCVGANITINGGTVRAWGGRGAGIGGGSGCAGTNITINAGEVSVWGGTTSAGIGGGLNGGGHHITINGGTVTATADAAGVGGGAYGVGSDITINGGFVTAWGSHGSAGIGGGDNAVGSGITINGGEVWATGTTDGAGIGGGCGCDGTGIAISGGAVSACGGTMAAGIGGGGYGAGSGIVIDGGTVEAESYFGAGIGGGSYGSAQGITINGGTVTAMSYYDVGIGSGSDGEPASGIYAADEVTVKAGAGESQTTVIPHASITTDLASALADKPYVEASSETGPVTQTYTVTWNANGGTVSPATSKFDFGTKVSAILKAAPTPKRTGWKFGGWYWDKELTDPLSDPASQGATVDYDATFYAKWTGGTVKTRVSVDYDSTMGKVTGAGEYAVGKKATLKATANKGYAFAGWYLDAECVAKADFGVDWRTPSVSYAATEEDAVFYAKFIAAADDVAAVSFELPAELTNGVTEVSAPVDVSGCTSLPTVKVSGLPTGLKFDAKANAIAGKATKSGFYTVVASVTTAGKATASASQQVVVRKADEFFLDVAFDETAGKATGAGVIQAGKSVTLKATANAAKKATKTTPEQIATVFAGWYADAGFTTPLEGAADFRNPSFAYVMPGDHTTVYAKFVAKTDDVAAVSFELPAELANGVTEVNADVDVSGCTSLPTVKVSGLPTGLKFDAKANAITGKATKSGVYTVVATVTTAGKATASASRTVVVRKDGEKVVTAEVPPIEGVISGKVTGMGVYAKGKDVTLKATANKGYVFAGWWENDALRSLDASYKFKMGEDDVAFTARFVTLDAEVTALQASLGDEPLSTAVPLEICASCGVDLRWSLAANGVTANAIAVSGLPTGLKFTAKDIFKKGSKTEVDVPANTIYGVPTKASTVTKDWRVVPFAVKVTVTTAGKQKVVYTVNVTTYGLPDYAFGTYNGALFDADTNLLGTATLTVTAKGAVSGKIIESDGTTWTAKAASYASTDETMSTFYADIAATAKVGGKTVERGFRAAVTYSDCGGQVEAAEDGTGAFLAAQQDLWKGAYKDDGAKLFRTGKNKYRVFEGDDVEAEGLEEGQSLVLKVETSGKVTATLKGGTYVPTATATLVPLTPPGQPKMDAVASFVFLPKASKGFAGLAVCAELSVSDVDSE